MKATDTKADRRYLTQAGVSLYVLLADFRLRDGLFFRAEEPDLAERVFLDEVSVGFMGG
jgi:hypothetical protein